MKEYDSLGQNCELGNFKKLFLFNEYVSFVCMCIRFPETVIAESCEPLCGSCKSNLDSLEEHSVSSLQSLESPHSLLLLSDHVSSIKSPFWPVAYKEYTFSCVVSLLNLLTDSSFTERLRRGSERWLSRSSHWLPSLMTWVWFL